ncbi:hypothetical protein RA086_03265 [Lactiplantibacillus sp. WILCCON 0030]|uniref:Uncharacterized protein n=1 Tax=Lactiplantibacillus brownii TaxID=3069269 RepID=A0ABU1A6T6_9LACO|nr:hypothetical protein [Lactiplantibacillus brownii]MDQ7936664.1 hypothetical protein [Lactiplantibacillus brownii]
MSEKDQSAWAISELKKLQTTDNQAVIAGIIKVIDDQQAEIDSLRGSMEGQLWSPNSWKKDQDEQHRQN